MPSKSKTKGNKFENEIVKVLNEACNTEEFCSTPGSGARMGLTNWGKNFGLSDNVKRTLGSDIITPEYFKFSIECKNYKNNPNYAKIIKSSDTVLDGWLGECIYDAINLNLHALLFFKTNYRGVYFALPDYFQNYINTKYLLLYGPVIISGIEIFTNNISTITNALSLDPDKEKWFQREDVQKLLKTLQ